MHPWKGSSGSRGSTSSRRGVQWGKIFSEGSFFLTAISHSGLRNWRSHLLFYDILFGIIFPASIWNLYLFYFFPIGLYLFLLGLILDFFQTFLILSKKYFFNFHIITVHVKISWKRGIRKNKNAPSKCISTHCDGAWTCSRHVSNEFPHSGRKHDEPRQNGPKYLLKEHSYFLTFPACF